MTRGAGLMFVALNCLSESFSLAAALPISGTAAPLERVHGLQLIDNRTYRHCHNQNRFVFCYKRKAGEPDSSLTSKKKYEGYWWPDHRKYQR
jgi:hypothetical protein